MKNQKQFHSGKWMAIALTFALLLASFTGGMYLLGNGTASADTALAADPSPAISVAKATSNSVVGVSSYIEQWDRSTSEQTQTLYSQGSGVVIAEGGYVLTNCHVVSGCTAFQILMPDGEYVDAQLVGVDQSTDLAVLKVDERANELQPVAVGSSANLIVGSTVIAIGNPGGEVLANSVTQGIVSALERNMKAGNTTRNIKYIQHDAAINSGNSGGGLFNVNGELVGINTLKYSGSVYSSVSFEGLGFAIPVDTAYPIAQDLIAYGEVRRPAIGVTVGDWEGPDEPMSNYPPASVMIRAITEGGPAEEVGLQAYDFITEIDGVRVTTLAELTTELDQHKEGDTVKLTVVRYHDLNSISGSYSYYYGDSANGSTSPFGSDIFGNRTTNDTSNAYETLTVDVTLRILVTE